MWCVLNMDEIDRRGRAIHAVGSPSFVYLSALPSRLLIKIYPIVSTSVLRRLPLQSALYKPIKPAGKHMMYMRYVESRFLRVDGLMFPYVRWQ